VCVKKESIMSGGSQQRWGINDVKACSSGEIAVSLCPDGYYKRWGYGTCSECTAGYSCANGNITICPIGTSSSAGASRCTPCQGGIATAAGSTVCSSCPDYTIVSQSYRGYSYDGIRCSGLPADPKGCIPGQYHNGSACVPCEPGKAARPEQLGYKSNFTCITCPAGTYTSTSASTMCTPVQQGYYSNAGATSETKCPRGYYCNDGTAPKPCPPGTYSNSEGSASCKPADVGHYSPGTIVPGSGSASGVPAIDQTKCPRMFYAASTQSTTCTACSAGQYSEEGAVACSSCPTGTQYDNSSRSCKAPSGTLTSGTRAVLLRNSGSSLTTLIINTSMIKCLKSDGTFTSNFKLTKIFYDSNGNKLYSAATGPASSGIMSTTCERVS
jgi:hypothetical protein